MLIVARGSLLIHKDYCEVFDAGSDVITVKFRKLWKSALRTFPLLEVILEGRIAKER